MARFPIPYPWLFFNDPIEGMQIHKVIAMGRYSNLTLSPQVKRLDFQLNETTNHNFIKFPKDVKSTNKKMLL